MPAPAGLRVLVVEDQHLIAMLIESYLGDLGHETCAIVASELDAVEAAARINPDLVIADVNLRPGNGPDAVEAIGRARGSPVASLFISGEAHRLRAERPDLVFLSKPFRARDLAAGIGKAMAAVRA